MPVPIIKTCLVCEDVRFERRNLLSFMGVYGVAPDVVIFIRRLDLPANVCFAFYGAPASGKFVVEAELRGPDGKLPARCLPPRVDLTVESDKGPVFVVFWFADVVFRKPDNYTIALRIDGQDWYTNTFRMDQATSDQTFV